jgi:hypothetical protein
MINITSPVGRIVSGSLYKPNNKDFDGNPLVTKTGPNAGQPRVQYFFGLAIPKGTEKHWAETEWGAKIWQVGHTAFPQAAQRPDFAWKITDGDSQVPNKRGHKPCDAEGHPGHWIIKFSGGYAPKVYAQENGTMVPVLEENYVKPGYWVQVAFSVDGNGNQNNSGVYLNHSMVCFRAYGQEIVSGPDVNEAGFGAAPLPAGASLTPPASTVPLPSVPQPSAPPGAAPLPPGASLTPTASPITLPSVPQPSAPPVTVVPKPGFVQMPVPTQPASPSASVGDAGITSIPQVPAPPVTTTSPSKMTALAQGVSREAFLAGGWTDEQLIASGYMTA